MTATGRPAVLDTLIVRIGCSRGLCPTIWSAPVGRDQQRRGTRSRRWGADMVDDAMALIGEERTERRGAAQALSARPTARPATRPAFPVSEVREAARAWFEGSKIAPRLAGPGRRRISAIRRQGGGEGGAQRAAGRRRGAGLWRPDRCRRGARRQGRASWWSPQAVTPGLDAAAMAALGRRRVGRIADPADGAGFRGGPFRPARRVHAHPAGDGRGAGS